MSLLSLSSGTAALAEAGSAAQPPDNTQVPSPCASPLPNALPTALSETPKRERTSRITIQPIFDGNRLALVTAELTLAELLGIEARSLEAALGDRLAAGARARLLEQTGRFLSVPQLAEIGIIAAYDPANLTIALSLTSEAVGSQSFTFQGEFKFGAAERARPSGFALGVTGNLIGSRDLNDGAASQQLLYNFTGFANFGARDGIYLSYGGTFNLADNGRPLFERDRVIAFKDFEKSVLRVAAGDVVVGLPLIAGEADIVGVSVERRYDALQPLRNIRPTGRRQFVVERPSRIEIYANGALVQALDVNAGPVDLNQIPALSLSSNISIIIEDSTGRREIGSFTLANDIELLAGGISEFSFSAGLMRKPTLGGGFAYSDTPMASGQYARGFSNIVTAGAHFALTANYQNVGATFASLALGGAVFAGASGSHHRQSGATGYAVSLAYRGDPLRLSVLDSQLNFRIDHRSAGYRALSQVIAPEPVKLDLALDYRINLTNQLAVSLGGTYLENHGGGETTKAAFAGAQVTFGRVLASATARYAQFGPRSDKGVLATLTVPLGRRHFSTASYDSATGQTRLEARRVRDITVPEFDYGMIAESGAMMDRLTGQARFANSRFNLDVELIATRPDSAISGRDQNVVNFRLQSGFAMADGVVGIGRNPGRGFVMVDKHSSLAGARADVENSGVGRRAAQSNAFGPAVVAQLSPYRPDNIRVSVLGAPAGYDIGAGEYISDPGALSGVRVKIGSDAYRSALVTFVLPDGTPVKLAEGVVRNLTTGETSGVFTNSAGRAVLSNLGQGNYRVELMGGDMIFDFTVEKTAPAIIKLGTQMVKVVP